MYRRTLAVSSLTFMVARAFCPFSQCNSVRVCAVVFASTLYSGLVRIHFTIINLMAGSTRKKPHTCTYTCRRIWSVIAATTSVYGSFMCVRMLQRFIVSVTTEESVRASGTTTAYPNILARKRGHWGSFDDKIAQTYERKLCVALCAWCHAAHVARTMDQTPKPCFEYSKSYLYGRS